MKLYHYITRPNTALKDGILSFAKNPNADLRYYYKRSGQVTHAGIAKLFESCFEGSSRGIRVFSEPIKWTENSLSLKEFVDNADMFSIDIDALYIGINSGTLGFAQEVNIEQIDEFIEDLKKVILK